MIDSVILNTPVIIIISVAAMIMNAAGRLVGNKYARCALNITSFLCMIGCTVYALLLGVELDELLAYILIFTLAGVTAFIPSASPDMPQAASAENKEQPESDNEEGENEL